MIAAYGTPVVAVRQGLPRRRGASGGRVVVQHGNGDWTFYAHLELRLAACPPAR